MRTGTPYAQHIKQHTTSVGLTPISSARITIGIITRTYQSQYQPIYTIQQQKTHHCHISKSERKTKQKNNLYCRMHNPIWFGNSTTNLSSFRKPTRPTKLSTHYVKEIFTVNYAPLLKICVFISLINV